MNSNLIGNRQQPKNPETCPNCGQVFNNLRRVEDHHRDKHGGTPKWFADWLEDWANFREDINGYSETTTIARAMGGQLNFNDFGPTIPTGVDEHSGWMVAINNLANTIAENQPKKAKYIEAVKDYYSVNAKNQRLNQDEKKLKYPRTQLWWVRRGEGILYRGMKARTIYG